MAAVLDSDTSDSGSSVSGLEDRDDLDGCLTKMTMVIGLVVLVRPKCLCWSGVSSNMHGQMSSLIAKEMVAQ